MKGSPLSLVSKLWALWSQCQTQLTDIYSLMTDCRERSFQSCEKGRPVPLPSSILCVLHLTPFCKERLCFPCEKEKTIWGVIVPHSCIIFSQDDFYLFWNSLAGDLNCVIPLKQVLEAWTFEPSTALSVGRAVVGPVHLGVWTLTGSGRSVPISVPIPFRLADGLVLEGGCCRTYKPCSLLTLPAAVEGPRGSTTNCHLWVDQSSFR